MPNPVDTLSDLAGAIMAARHIHMILQERRLYTLSLKALEEKLNETLLSLYYTHGFFGHPAIFPVQ
jgi:hypothetical protein